MTKRIFIFLFLTIIWKSNSLFGQIPNNIFNEITGDKYDKKDFADSKLSYKLNVGVYHFGESEAEWDLVFISYADSLIIQIWNGIWAEEIGIKNLNWINKCQTFNSVKIEGNKFYFGSYSGQFVEYKEGESKAVILFGDPIQGRNYEIDSAEVGFYSYSIDTFFDSKERYELSKEIRPETFFKTKSKQELKILRNTIFANYGLIFQKGGEMEIYFSKKEWYNPYLKNVSNCLTEIEKRNLSTLQKFENQ